MEFISKEEVAYLDSATQEERYKFLNEVFSRIHNKSVEDAMRATPDLTAKLLKSTAVVNDMMRNFKKKHPEYIGNEELVKKIIMDVEVENPGANYEDILTKAEPRIANALDVTINEAPVDKSKLSLIDLDNKFLL